ncbi:MAG: sulfur carrier protein ThiS [Actinobacteria bacterium]|nr:sulfur carrier protein ThiS [Actinomycetota bacterium]
MKVVVNGATREVDQQTLGELLDVILTDTRGSAAAVDGEVVPRAGWAGFALHEGQSVEILTAVQGG